MNKIWFFHCKIVMTGLVLAGVGLLLAGCNNQHAFDASGAFETDEILVPAEIGGIIRALDIREGEQLDSGVVVGQIDTVQLALKRKQLLAQVRSVRSRNPDIEKQTAFYDQQMALAQVRLDNLLQEERRFKQLVASEAATQKQLDDISALVREAREQIKVIGDQKRAQVSLLRTQQSALAGDELPLEVQVEQLEDQLRRCRIVNPIHGTVLTQYTFPGEMIAMGQPVYKVADLRTMYLRAYISGDQLPGVRLGQAVTVLTDDGEGGFHEDRGTIRWISDKAEFTPKTIQTKDERANLVYAIKVAVPNDGRYKIGMYGEVNLQ